MPEQITCISSGYDKNFVIISGLPMSNVSATSANYYFQYFDFSKIQTQNFNENPTSGDLVTIMEGKKALVYIPLINNVGKSIFASDIDGNILNNADFKKYNNLPVGMVTAAGSIITQPFVPSDGYFNSRSKASIYNGVVFSGDTDKTQTVSGSLFPYVWSAQQVQLNVSSIKNPVAYGQNNSSAGSLQKTYGQREQQFNYITNKFQRQAGIDDGIIADRYYNCSAYDKGGAFVFCYNYGPYTPAKVVALANKQQPPELILNISAVFYNDDDSFKTSDNQSAGISGKNQQCTIQIPPDGQITARIGKLKAQGGLSVPANDLLPPQCQREGNQFTTIPLFIYPIYSGLVITNSIIKNSKNQKGDQIFVAFNGKSDPRFQTKINNTGNVGFMTGLSPQQSNYIYSSKDSKNALKWFPAIFQQTNRSLIGNIGLSVHSNYRVNFNGKIKLECIRSLCNFACCPLFFSRILKFTLYFKGANLKSTVSSGQQIQNNSTVKYYFYPIAYDATIYEENTSFQFNKGAKKNSKGLFISMVSATSYCKDDEHEQTIYKTEFQFQANRALRYPLQVFGAVMVMQRLQHPFSALSANGSFSLFSSSTFYSCFNSALLKNNIHNTNNTNLFNLITNCDLQYGMDGVTGNLTLDSFPISGSLGNLLLQQSIGQLDLDIAFIDSGNNLIDENGSSLLITSDDSDFCIFKGYAMQAATNNSENNYSVGINLIGTQRKMQDMKLVCAPFWDGDRLEAICSYFQDFLNVTLKMVNYNVSSSLKGALPIGSNSIYSHVGTWKAYTSDTVSLYNSGQSQEFRVGRSWNWQSPHINFTTGTSCFQALNKLAQDTACAFIVGRDGIGYFYQLNVYGYPYYVDNQIKSGNVVEIKLNMITSFSLHPDIQSKYNAIATFGFLIKKTDNKEQRDALKVSTAPGSFYTRLDDENKTPTTTSPTTGGSGGGNNNSANPQNNLDTSAKFNYPWQRTTLSVQNGYFTKLQLLRAHVNRINRSKASLFSGSVTVIGNNKVNHIYQVIKIHDKYFMVNSINHSFDVSGKKWTSTYGIQWASLFNTGEGNTGGGNS